MFSSIIWVGDVPWYSNHLQALEGKYFFPMKKNFTAFISALFGALAVTGATAPVMWGGLTMAILDHAFAPFPFLWI